MKTTLFQIIFLLALGAVVTRAIADSPATVYETTLMESGQKTLEVSTSDLRKILAEKSATVFDARPLMEYSMSHIPGAVNVSKSPGSRSRSTCLMSRRSGASLETISLRPSCCIATDLSAVKANDFQRN